MARLLGLLGVVLLLTACTPGMQRFTLPENVAPPAPAAQQGPPALAALAGPWTGTWFTPDWGLGYDALLLVESIDADQATVLYAWTNPGRGGDGWYRQKARLLPGPGLEWTRGTWTFRLHLDPDGARLAGTTERATPPDKAFITMERTPFAAPPPKAAAGVRRPSASPRRGQDLGPRRAPPRRCAVGGHLGRHLGQRDPVPLGRAGDRRWESQDRLRVACGPTSRDSRRPAPPRRR